MVCVYSYLYCAQDVSLIHTITMNWLNYFSHWSHTGRISSTVFQTIQYQGVTILPIICHGIYVVQYLTGVSSSWLLMHLLHQVRQNTVNKPIHNINNLFIFYILPAIKTLTQSVLIMCIHFSYMYSVKTRVCFCCCGGLSFSCIFTTAFLNSSSVTLYGVTVLVFFMLFFCLVNWRKFPPPLFCLF